METAWYEAWAYCDGLRWGGHEDWVLPDDVHLHGLVDFGEAGPALDPVAFVNAPHRFPAVHEAWWRECYWSSATTVEDPQVAWVLMSNSGDIAEGLSDGPGSDYHLADKAAAGWGGCYVRCVRGVEEPPAVRFERSEEITGEPEVFDRLTWMTWQGCVVGLMGTDCGAGEAAELSWGEGLATCEGLTWAGQDDWRLPNVKELRSIVDSRRARPAVEDAMFPNVPQYRYGETSDRAGQHWSSTAREGSFALYVDFNTGFSHFYLQSEGRNVRCVRGGQTIIDR